MKISIEGNIGAGKSTVFGALEKAFPDYTCMCEPIQEWGELLDLFYADPKAWSLPLSVKILLGFRKALTMENVIVERSPLTCRDVFTNLLATDGTMDAHQHDIFKQLYGHLGWKPDAIVFIDTPVHRCMDRVHARGRSCEASVDMQYLKRIEFAYRKMLEEHKDMTIIRVDGTKQPAFVAAETVNAVARILAPRT